MVNNYTEDSIKKQKANIEKASRRKEFTKLARPSWLSDYHKDIIKGFYTISRNVTEAHKEAGEKLTFQVDHLVPIQHPLVCGLDVPWNMQIIDSVTNKQKGDDISVQEIPGSIMMHHVEDFMHKGKKPRYKGKFIKGFTGNSQGRTPDLEKIVKRDYDRDSAFKEEITKIRNTVDDNPHEFFKSAVETLMMNAETKQELFMYLKEFGQYYQPKLASKDSDETKKDKKIEITFGDGDLANLIQNAGEDDE